MHNSPQEPNMLSRTRLLPPRHAFQQPGALSLVHIKLLALIFFHDLGIHEVYFSRKKPFCPTDKRKWFGVCLFFATQRKRSCFTQWIVLQKERHFIQLFWCSLVLGSMNRRHTPCFFLRPLMSIQSLKPKTQHRCCSKGTHASSVYVRDFRESLMSAVLKGSVREM